MTTTTRLSALTGDYVLDRTRTRIGFVARQVMVTTVRGQFDEFDGHAHLDGESPSESSAQLTIQAKSIQTRNELRDEHLRGHFLDAPNYPTLSFTSTEVEQVSETSFIITGDLTIRGVTELVSVDMELTGVENDSRGNFRVDFAGTATINRKNWGVSWNAVVEGGGVFVSEQVTLEFEVAAVRRS